MPSTIRALVDAMTSIAPPQYAAEWDNVGLLIGSTQASLRRVLLTIDLTAPVLAEAGAARAEAIVAYHPPIFEALKAVSDATPRQRLILEAAATGIAVYSPHTALDAAPGGLNDWLAESFGSGDVRAIKPHEHLPETEQVKIVTFCPAEAAEKLRNGLASMGAGRIGNYEHCSFEIAGTGTFLGGEGTQPAIGRRGALERVSEVRLEMVCPRAALALAVTALRQFHPYEEPPIEIYALQPRPLRNVGQGSRIVLDQKAGLKTIIQKIKKRLGVEKLAVAPGHEAPQRFQKIGVCAGAGGALVDSAIDQGCDLFFTGEMRHHDVLHAQARGCTIILAGHTATERPYLPVLRKRLQSAIPEVEIAISKRDVSPLRSI